MSLVQDLTPINLEEEKRKFFDKDGNYNPQFKYKKLITINMLYRYGKPKPKFIELAKQILKKSFQDRTETDIRKMEGEHLSQQQAKLMIKDFITNNHLENEVEVKWSEDFAGKASFYIETLKLKLPIWHREKEFLGTLYHEIGTHALRRINYAKQPFFKKKSQYGFGDYLMTEEGLASFHTLLARNFKLDYTGALNYEACDFAQSHSFSETYAFVGQYLQDQERCWQYTYKLKRGLYDTSQGGGFTKDTLYLEGMVQVWRYFQESNFDVEGLYFGKINSNDVKKAREMNPDFLPKLPNYYQTDPEAYRKLINSIAEENSFSQL